MIIHYCGLSLTCTKAQRTGLIVSHLSFNHSHGSLHNGHGAKNDSWYDYQWREIQEL